MNKLPFYIGNIVSCFVPNNKRRSRVRGWINVMLYRHRIMSFVKTSYGVKPKHVRFVRQITLNRMTCVVDNVYYVKIFRNVTVQQLENFKFLLDFIRPYINVEIPDIIVDKRMPMYVCKKIPGRPISDFDAEFVLKHEKSFLSQVADIIAQLQSVDVKSVPGWERFVFSMQPERTVEKPCDSEHMVFAHFDLNRTNFLFDDDFNIIGLIDWDTLSVAKNPETDWDIFMKYWNNYKRKHRK